MIEPKSFLFDVRDGVARITLNRPERLNALTFEVYRELTDTFAALQTEDEARVVVLTGAASRARPSTLTAGQFFIEALIHFFIESMNR